jgi:hypothetical protein
VYACMYACRYVGKYATTVYVDVLYFPYAHYVKKDRYCEDSFTLAIHISLTPFPRISSRWRHMCLHFMNFGFLFADINKA